MNADNARFVYAADERVSISGCADLSDDDWRYLETIAAEYLGKYFRQLLTKRRASQLEDATRKLELQIQGLSPAATDAENGWCLWSPNVSVLLKFLSEIKVYANSQLKPKNKRKQSNRARHDDLDAYLALLVLRFMQLGGKPGRAPSSPCAKFVDAAASPVLVMTHFELDKNAISNLIRSRVWFVAEDFSAPRPEVGKPNLSIESSDGDCV